MQGWVPTFEVNVNMPEFESHTAIVTGAAGGMGAAIARVFAAEKRPMILCDMHPGPLGELAASIGSNAEVSIVAGDVDL